MSDADRKAYLAHMDNLRVQKDVLDTAKLEGLAEGRAEGLAEGRAEGLAEGIEQGMVASKMEIAKNMKAAGLNAQVIMQFTGLTQTQIDQL